MLITKYVQGVAIDSTRLTSPWEVLKAQKHPPCESPNPPKSIHKMAGFSSAIAGDWSNEKKSAFSNHGKISVEKIITNPALQLDWCNSSLGYPSLNINQPPAKYWLPTHMPWLQSLQGELAGDPEAWTCNAKWLTSNYYSICWPHKLSQLHFAHPWLHPLQEQTWLSHPQFAKTTGRTGRGRGKVGISIIYIVYHQFFGPLKGLEANIKKKGKNLHTRSHQESWVMVQVWVSGSNEAEW